MILKNKNGESVYFEYMLKITLDDKELILATNEKIPNRIVDAIITIPSGISKGIDIVECTGSVGAITLEVYNIDCNFSKILAQYERGAGFYFRKAELFLVKKTGESLLATGLLRSIKPKDYMETIYTLEIADFMSELMKKPTLLFKSKTEYADEITINRGTMTDDEVVIIGNDIALNLFVMFASTYQEFTMELELTEFDSLELGDILLITHDKIIDTETGERGITETSIDNYLYCRLDVDSWGDYIPSYEGSVYYSSDFTTEKSYNVDKIVKNSWYDAVIEANTNNKIYAEFLRG